MSEFSALLDCYIERSKLTENQLAQISGFSRSYIALIKNGRRLPSDINKLKLLMDALLLSPGCQEKLWRAYYIERYGLELYKTRMEIKDFIRDQRSSRLSKHVAMEKEVELPGKVQSITGHLDLELAVQTILNREAKRAQGYIKLVLQGDFDFVYRHLAVMLTRPIRVDHIVCLHNSHTDHVHGQHEGLKFLSDVMPAVLADSNDQYEIFYYHGDPDCQFGAFSLMPYMIMTSEYVISISGDRMHALAIRDSEIHKIYGELFEKSKSISQALFCHRLEKLNLPMSYSEDAEYILSGMLPDFSDADVQDNGQEPKYIYLDREGVLEALKNNPEIGFLSLEMLIHGAEVGRYHIYLLKNLECSHELQLTVHGSAYVEIVVGILGKRITIREQSIVQLFHSFLTHMEHNTVCSEIEGIKFIEALLAQGKTR